jgi:hypothetical protein
MQYTDRPAHFWDFTQRRMVFLTNVSEQPVGPNLMGQAVQEETTGPLKMGLICFPETFLRNHHSALRKIPKERRSHFPTAEA